MLMANVEFPIHDKRISEGHDSKCLHLNKLNLLTSSDLFATQKEANTFARKYCSSLQQGTSNAFLP